MKRYDNWITWNDDRRTNVFDTSTVIEPDVAVRLWGLPTSGRICLPACMRRTSSRRTVTRPSNSPTPTHQALIHNGGPETTSPGLISDIDTSSLTVRRLVAVKNFELNLPRVVADLTTTKSSSLPSSLSAAATTDYIHRLTERRLSCISPAHHASSCLHWHGLNPLTSTVAIWVQI